MSKLSVEELAQAISSFVNGASIDKMEQLAQAMANDHPTLQQNKMKLAMLFVEQMAEKPYTDARNRMSKEIAVQIVKNHKEAEKNKARHDGLGLSESYEKFIDEKVVPSGSLPTI